MSVKLVETVRIIQGPISPELCANISLFNSSPNEFIDVIGGNHQV